jgi:hypothetical protein
LTAATVFQLFPHGLAVTSTLSASSRSASPSMMESKLLSNGYVATPLPLKSQGAPTSPSLSTSRCWNLRCSRGWRASVTTQSTLGSGSRRSSSTTFRGAITCAGTRHDLAHCKQERNELLRSYTRHFFASVLLLRISRRKTSSTASTTASLTQAFIETLGRTD